MYEKKLAVGSNSRKRCPLMALLLLKCVGDSVYGITDNYKRVMKEVDSRMSLYYTCHLPISPLMKDYCRYRLGSNHTIYIESRNQEKENHE